MKNKKFKMIIAGVSITGIVMGLAFGFAITKSTEVNAREKDIEDHLTFVSTTTRPSGTEWRSYDAIDKFIDEENDKIIYITSGYTTRGVSVSVTCTDLNVTRNKEDK